MTVTPLDVPCPTCLAVPGEPCQGIPAASDGRPTMHLRRFGALGQSVANGGPAPSPEPELPMLPYAGTSGWSGTDSSRDATIALDEAGITAASQRRAYEFVADRGRSGATVAEVRDATGLHHGRASSALSILHMDGALALLMERRNRSRVYVLPRFVDDRPTTARRRNKPKVTDLEALRAMLAGSAVVYREHPGVGSAALLDTAGARFVFNEWGSLVSARPLH